MEQSAVSTYDVATNLFDLAFSNHENCEKGVDGFKDLTPEEHFDVLITCLENFLDAAENSEYLEDMEDTLGAVVGVCIAVAVSAGLFTEPVDINEEV